MEKKEKKSKEGKVNSKMSVKDLEDEVEKIENKMGASGGEVSIKASKPMSKVGKGDRVKVDGKEYEVDAHYVLIDHGGTKEMALEIFDSKADKDLQVRYFDDQVESTLELYELQEIMYVRRQMKSIEW